MSHCVHHRRHLSGLTSFLGGVKSPPPTPTLLRQVGIGIHIGCSFVVVAPSIIGVEVCRACGCVPPPPAPGFPLGLIFQISLKMHLVDGLTMQCIFGLELLIYVDPSAYFLEFVFSLGHRNVYLLNVLQLSIQSTFIPELSGENEIGIYTCWLDAREFLNAPVNLVWSEFNPCIYIYFHFLLCLSSIRGVRGGRVLTLPTDEDEQ